MNTPVPELHIGTADGFNASTLFLHGQHLLPHKSNVGICEVYGMTLHRRTDEIDPQFDTGYENAKRLVAAWNATRLLTIEEIEALKL